MSDPRYKFKKGDIVEATETFDDCLVKGRQFTIERIEKRRGSGTVVFYPKECPFWYQIRRVKLVKPKMTLSRFLSQRG